MLSTNTSTRLRIGLAATVWVLLLSACGLSQNTTLSAVKAAGIQPVAELKDVALTVGSKEFDEQIILSQITIAALQAAGAAPVDKTGLQGTGTTRTALTSGQIDLYWEYTASAWFSILGQTKPLAGNDLYEAVSAKDLADHKIVWLPAAPLNDTYAIAVNSAFAKESGIKTLSQMSDYIAKNPAAGSLCVENEFLQRDDGLSGMKTAYAMQGLQSKLMGVAVVYSQVAEGKACNFGEIYSTDGRIGSLDLVTLTDDKGFFKTYNPAPTVRLETLTKYPELKTLLEPVIAKLDTQTMTRLNAEAAAGKSPRDVAITWLQANGFIG